MFGQALRDQLLLALLERALDLKAETHRDGRQAGEKRYSVHAMGLGTVPGGAVWPGSPADQEDFWMAATPIIALDAMCGDHGPDVIVSAADLALIRHPDAEFIIVGDAARITPS